MLVVLIFGVYHDLGSQSPAFEHEDAEQRRKQ
jgi:hypothetical protein